MIIHATEDDILFQSLEVELARPALGHELAVNGKGLDVSGKEKAGAGLTLGLPALGWLGMPLWGQY